METMPYFGFWCYKVLPLVYDDSLSYYEVLCKVVKYINGLIAQDKIIGEELNNLRGDLDQVEDWIAAFDTEVAERIIREALDNLTGVLFTSTITDCEDAATVINTAIENGCKTICVDADILLTTNLELRSNMLVQGMGGIITCTGAGLWARGARGNLVATAADVREGNINLTVNGASQMEVGKRYFIIGSDNLINRDDDYSLGTGTAGAQTCYGGMEFVVTAISGSTVTMDRLVPHYIGNAAIYTTNTEISNLVLRDLRIIGNNHLIQVRYGHNVSVENCILTCDANYPLYMIYCYECYVTRCAISEKANDTYNKNVIVLSSCGECVIDQNIISGGYQGIDLTYDGNGGVYSYGIIVSNNIVNHAVTGSFTTHPAALKNMIIGNTFSADIQLRCRGNQILNNTIGDHIYISGNRVDGTVIKGNTFTGTVPLQLTYHGDTEAVSYVDRVIFDSNICTKCTKVIDGVNEGKTLAIYVTNNTFIGTGATGYVIAASPTLLNPEYYQFYLISNTFMGFNKIRIFGSDDVAVTCIRVKIENNNFFVSGSNSEVRFAVGSGTITGKVSGNDMNFEDGITTLQSKSFGANYPSAPLKGDTFLKNDGTYAIWDGLAWKVITTT